VRFDGDEMNAHNPQSIQTMSELMDFASVPYHIITPKDAGPIIEIVQDTMVGVYRLTKQHIRLTDKVLANLQMVNSYFKGELPKPAEADDFLYTGRQTYSQILPPSLYLKLKNKANETFTIENSAILDGTIDKKVLTTTSKGMLPVMFHDYGPFEVRRFIDNTQRLICRWLMTAGFSVGISDLVIPPEIHKEIYATIQEEKEKAYQKMDAVRRGEIVNNTMLNNRDYMESVIINILNGMNNTVSNKVTDNLSDIQNRLVNMVKSGSKGKPQNVAQMIANVGQQNVDGKRVAYGFTDRTLPHYTKFDDGPEARGFVENSFISGLTPQEVFFHAMGGREGLIDTAVKTSDTGYLQRRLVKAMEDCKIYNDQTVRNASGNIIQFIYGEDGLEGTKIEQQTYPILEMAAFETETQYHLRPEDELERYLTDEGKETLKQKSEQDWISRCEAHYNQLLEDRERLIVDVFHRSSDIQLQYAVPFARIIDTAYQRMKTVGSHVMPTDLTPCYILDTIERLKKDLFVIREQGVYFLHSLLHLHLSPKKMILGYRFPKAVFDWVVGEIERTFNEAVAPAGEMVGIIAAQSLGEYATQLTLDSFHVSGTAAAVKATSGVPRLKELLSVSKNIKTPTLKIYLKRDIGTVIDPITAPEEAGGAGSEAACYADPRIAALKERALNVRNQLEITRLSHVLDETEIYWDPPLDGYETAIEKDRGLMELYRSFEDMSKCQATSPWLLRMKINKEKLYHNGLTMMDIYMKLYEAYPQTMECVFTDDNADELVFRIRLMAEKEKKKAAAEELEEGGEDEEGQSGPTEEDDAVAALKSLEHNIVHNLILKGSAGIKKVSMRSQERKEYDPATAQFHALKEWVLETDGTNLIEMLCNPNVDSTRVISNDIWEIFEALGIEAARTALYQEIMEVIRESSVNYRHLSLLIDTMTHKGSLMSIDRHGINRGDVGPLAKSSFEETTDMLNNAGVFSDYDKINGVSANIMLGQLPPCGTGDSEILLDEEGYLALLKDHMEKSKRVKAKAKDAEPVSPVVLTPEIPADIQVVHPCELKDLTFAHKMPKKSKKMVAFEIPDAPF
jgi:DNA-directed RNA polymerase II subunit RPB1